MNRVFQTGLLTCVAAMAIGTTAVNAQDNDPRNNTDRAETIELVYDDGGMPGAGLRLFTPSGEPVRIIDFPKSKKFLRFKFPKGYSDVQIRVFERNEGEQKTDILQTYVEDPAKGIRMFDAQWGGKASSEQFNREFEFVRFSNKHLTIRNHNRDGTETGTMHDYILKYTVEGRTVLVDPSIRNKIR